MSSDLNEAKLRLEERKLLFEGRKFAIDVALRGATDTINRHGNLWWNWAWALFFMNVAVLGYWIKDASSHDEGIVEFALSGRLILSSLSFSAFSLSLLVFSNARAAWYLGKKLDDILDCANNKIKNDLSEVGYCDVAHELVTVIAPHTKDYGRKFRLHVVILPIFSSLAWLASMISLFMTIWM